MRDHIVFASLMVLIESFGAAPRANSANPDFDVAVPKDVQVSTLLPFPDAAAGILAPDTGFDIDPDGLPVVADGTSLKVMGAKAPLMSLGKRIDDFAWMRDGALLLVSENHLAGLGSGGLVIGLELPNPGMRIRPAGLDTAYVAGGASEPANHDVNLFARDKRIAKLATVPAPVSAIAGDGATTYVAIGAAVLRFSGTEPVRLLLQAPEPIVSLDKGPNGLFYATAARVGYVTDDGNAYDFIVGQGGLLRVRGSSLYLLVHDGARLIRFNPVDAFDSFSKSFSQKN
jgi:hypothetical protein